MTRQMLFIVLQKDSGLFTSPCDKQKNVPKSGSLLFTYNTTVLLQTKLVFIMYTSTRAQCCIQRISPEVHLCSLNQQPEEK